MIRDNAIAGLICLGLAAYVYWLAGSVPEGAALDPLGGRFLPKALAVALAIFSAALLLTSLLGVRVKGGQAAQTPEVDGAPQSPAEAEEMGIVGEEEASAPAPESTRSALLYAAAMGLYVWLLPYTGFLATSLVLFTVFIYLLGQRSLGKALLVSAALTGGLYGLFGVLFGVRLPTGSLF